MIWLFLIVIPTICIIIKLLLHLIVWKFGKFSYDGFSAAGFAYNAEKDIFYSTKNAWQKHFGYTHKYDVLAPLFRMLIDTETIKFYYNNKNWLITFWKGQYGIVTGAEIGIYNTNQRKINKKTIYMPAKDKEMLDMSLVLYKKGKIIAKMKAKHWWLAVFKLGLFSKPKELTMDISIKFPNQEMLVAFLSAFMKLGYKKKDFYIHGNTFYFRYKKPRTRKVWTRSWIVETINQFLNHKNVNLYNEYLYDLIENDRVDDSKTIGDKKLIMLKDFIPSILKNSKDEEVNINKIYNNKEKNIIFLDSKVYSGLKENSHDKKNR